jgi:hypothetical protein
MAVLDGTSRSFLESLGIKQGSPVFNNATHLGVAFGDHPVARDYIESQGWDIVAGKGFVGRLSSPTTILAGEAGPEDVMIAPTRNGGGFLGGGSGAGGTTNHFAITVNSLDPRGMRELASGELGDIILQRIKESSERCDEVMFNGGVVTPPSV